MNQAFDAIIVTADEPYGQMWHTQLIYADSLSQKYKVFFIAAPKKWEFVNVFKRKYDQNKVSQNLIVINYLNIFPSKWNAMNDRHLEKFVSGELIKHSAKRILIWHFDSFRSSFSGTLFTQKFNIKRIYHVIDPFYRNPLNEYLSETADVLVVTSPRNNVFYEKYKTKLINIPQCLDLKQQRRYLEGENKLPLKFEPGFVVMLGTISDDLDFRWLDTLIADPNLKLVIIGKIINGMKESESWEKIIAKQNVQYMGMLKPEEFYPVLKLASTGLIVYNEKRRSVICSPLKAMNYLVSHIPVVTNTECELEKMDGCLFNVKDVKEMEVTLKKIRSGKMKFDRKRADAFLQEHTIEGAIDKIVSKL